MGEKGVAACARLCGASQPAISGQQRHVSQTHGKVLVAQKRGSASPTKETVTPPRKQLTRRVGIEKKGPGQ